MKTFREFFAERDLPVLTEIATSDAENRLQILVEGQWIGGRFDRNIRIDHPTHGVGQTHAHIYARNGQEWGVVNLDGSSSHGTRCTLHRDDAEALRAKGFKIKRGNIVEWVAIQGTYKLFFGS